MDRVIALGQISVTAQCYSSILFRKWQENPSSRHEGILTQRLQEESAPARGGERQRQPFGSSFYIYFFLPLGPALCKLGLARSAVLPEVLTLIFVLFSQAFPFLSFSHHHFGLLFPLLTT